MCGLSFVHDTRRPPQALAEASERALAALAHRGPDDAGLWQDGPVALGHRRLAIIDLDASRQPMHDDAGRFVLVFNGEIYNYRDLRRALDPHWHFRTDGDTEVLLAGLARHGGGFCARMEGMWAFALWDRERRELTLGRDRMGKKPLYHTAVDGGIACTSELPALRHLTAGFGEDLDGTADYLRYGYCLPGHTLYRGVHELLPGHVGTWRPGGALAQAPFWELPLERWRGSREAARETLRATLTRAVDRRLVADVEVGAFLSGGVDSSLIVGLMSRELGRRPKTFTIGFEDASHDERGPAERVARRFGTDHRVEVLADWNADELERLLLDHVGQPFADSSLLPTALVSRLAARHVKVALSGDGGDELFSGYQRYQARVLLAWYTRLPAAARRGVDRLARALPEPAAHHSASLLKKFHLFNEAAHRLASETPYVAPRLYSDAQFEALAPELVGRGHTPPGLPGEAALDDVQVMMARDALIYLPQDILRKVDRCTMSSSLEARAPFLDSDLVRLAFSLPRRWHRRGIAGKHMLRESFAALLPADIWRRRKQGFAVPVGQWFRGALGDRLESMLSRGGLPFRAEPVLERLAAHRAGARDHGHRLWSIYAYLLWREQGAWRAS